MSRTTVRSRSPLAGRRVVLTLAVGATALLTLAGCGTSRLAQTASQVSTAEGVNASAGGILLRNVAIEPPESGVYEAGSDAEITGVIINDSQSDDRLVGVQTQVASNVTLAAGASASPSISATALPSESQSASEAESPAESGSESASPSESPSESEAASQAPETGSNEVSPSPSESSSASPSESAARINLLIPVEGYAQISRERPLRLHNLDHQLRPGEQVQVTFTFARAGSTTVLVPVVTPSSPRPTESFSPSAGLGEPPTS